MDPELIHCPGPSLCPSNGRDLFAARPDPAIVHGGSDGVFAPADVVVTEVFFAPRYTFDDDMDRGCRRDERGANGRKRTYGPHGHPGICPASLGLAYRKARTLLLGPRSDLIAERVRTNDWLGGGRRPLVQARNGYQIRMALFMGGRWDLYFRSVDVLARQRPGRPSDAITINITAYARLEGGVALRRRESERAGKGRGPTRGNGRAPEGRVFNYAEAQCGRARRGGCRDEEASGRDRAVRANGERGGCSGAASVDGQPRALAEDGSCLRGRCELCRGSAQIPQGQTTMWAVTACAGTSPGTSTGRRWTRTLVLSGVSGVIRRWFAAIGKRFPVARGL
ncbi:predicted protein [Postia placenta Mad-698-R]|uniref:Uncharacterized protein n=1 Tax=Postia placenta MAD-698-R-SB12 TaxID=670580 RepID=A0A1X6MYN6_9APHY|nr:hypothetical protein POSPLADRAFT_1046837 [Postia placenta MAD-698-R-SB12]EED81382.1 predicted protein [Postia placenta Mad-698-R]OSX61467.1 hypothetical protein POSPLADRAFT_1046837 [Postia placenta MAD-698-R-SB12]